MIFKILFKKETHLLNKQVNYKELNEFIRKSFKNIPKNYSITYFDEDGDQISVDSENDFRVLYQCCQLKILKLTIEEVRQETELLKNSISDDQSIQIIQNSNQHSCQQLKDKQIKNLSLSQPESKQISIESFKKEEQKKIEINNIKIDEKILHPFTCSLCKSNPIIGSRFHCLLCENINYCQKCEFNNSHVHPLLKINYPEQQKLIYKFHQKIEIINSQNSFHNNIQKKKIETYGKDSINDQQKILRNAEQLSNLFGIYFNYALKIAQSYPTLNKEELVVKYIMLNKEMSGMKNVQLIFKN